MHVPPAPRDVELHVDYPDVDVAIIAESTYPYLKGGVSAVIHDIISSNQDLTFGIIHITWDSTSPSEDLYGLPDNVRWVRPVYLSMAEHDEDFRRLTPSDLGMRARGRRELSHRLLDALQSAVAGDVAPLWRLYDEGMNPRTRRYPLWALLGTKEFMVAAGERLSSLGLPLTDTFWLLREFFSLACAVLGEDLPRARVYHAHTTGYAALLGAAGARQHDTSFLLTEHNLYVRDTINFMLGRSLGLTVAANDWRESDVTPRERAWMAWWIEMGRFSYPSAQAITYLYPRAITEAADLGAPVEKSVVIPNGMTVQSFRHVYQRRMQALSDIMAAGPQRTWRLAYVGRVVPIKGLTDLIASIALLVERGVTDLRLDILGPTDHHPDYYLTCLDKVRTLGVEDYVAFHGTVDVLEVLGDYDLLVLPSHNEAQPMVVLEAMTAGIPVVGTNVGGMEQLVEDPLTTPGGRTLGPCGLLVPGGDVTGMADALEAAMADRDGYVRFAHNARARVENFFQLQDAMGAYNRLYKELGGLVGVPVESRDDAEVIGSVTAMPLQSELRPVEGSQVPTLANRIA
ncbi:MAG TPA: GT4 family glycosyltransferase PelF [Intrasporangium sp.]|uniref:GT4 family glycosyltransferase PelF n=1 Tax=Intrasporangium sp. TaxID=1925024 RepID=UPI002D7A2333|nr:GT4 family glycosyltransferase PelF [Intrasporangium sp.]HET7398069.1 GT4 family glycosyltransferase PelF [Intrasporangium sp.]